MRILICIALASMACVADAGETPPSDDIVITATPIDPAVLARRQAEEEAQLRRNLHQLRVIMEQESAQANAVARGNAGTLHIAPSDAPSLGAMREQLADSMERLEDRCFGLEAKAENGNVIVICGDNSGSAENTNVRNSADTTLVLPPLAAAAPTPDGEEGGP